MGLGWRPSKCCRLQTTFSPLDAFCAHTFICIPLSFLSDSKNERGSVPAFFLKTSDGFNPFTLFSHLSVSEHPPGVQKNNVSQWVFFNGLIIERPMFAPFFLRGGGVNNFGRTIHLFLPSYFLIARSKFFFARKKFFFLRAQFFKSQPHPIFA